MKNDNFILASLKIDNQDFSSRVAVLLISVGKKEHEGENFAAAVDMADSVGFKKILIVVADTLQAYSIKGIKNINLESAILEAKNAGDAWIEKHKRFYENNKKFNLMRWDELKEHKSYFKYYNELIQIYKDKENPVTKSINESAKDIVGRYNKYIKETKQRKKFEECSTLYLLEELPILTKIFNSLGVSFIIYPSNQPKAFSEMSVDSNGYKPIKWCRFTLKERSFENLKNTILSKNNGFSCGRDKIIAILKERNFYISTSPYALWNQSKAANEETSNSVSSNIIIYQVLEKQEEALFSSLKLLKESEKNSYLSKLRHNIDSMLPQEPELIDNKSPDFCVIS